MTQLVFIYGQVASGKLTVARKLAEMTGMALFHNHLIVDAVAAVFPFGSEPFIRLREQFWLQVFRDATTTGRSLIFTFAPEPTVATDFAQKVQTLAARYGVTLLFVALTVGSEEQERRLVAKNRAAFGKMRDLDLLRALRPELAACMAAMPSAHLSLDTETLNAQESASAIARLLSN